MSRSSIPVLPALISVLLCACSAQCQGLTASEHESKDSARYDVVVEHARTNMELAEVELRFALEENGRIPKLVPALAIERLRSNLAVARQQYAEAKMASAGGPERVRRRHAEEKVRLAKLALESGKQVRAEGRISRLQVRRLELKHNLAKLNLALLDNPENFRTLLYDLESKLNHLGDEIVALDQRVSRLEPVRP